MSNIMKKFLVVALLAAAVCACGLTAVAAEDGVVKQDIDSVLATAKPVPEDRDLGEIFDDKLLESRQINGLSESGLPAATVEHLRNIGFPVDAVKKEEKYQDLYFGTGDIYIQYSADSEHRVRFDENGKLLDIFNAGDDILAPDWDYEFDTTEEQYMATGEKVKAMLGLDENYKLTYSEGFSNDYWSMSYKRVLPNGIENVHDGVNITVARKNCSVAFLHYFDLPVNALEAEITEDEALAAAKPVMDRLKAKKVDSVQLHYVKPNFYWEDKYYEDVDFIRLAYEIKLNKGQYLVHVDAVTGEVIGGDMAIGIFEEEPEADENGFTDTCKHWAAGAIDYVVSKGILNGTSESKFEPNVKMNRAMLVTALWRLEGRPLYINEDNVREIEITNGNTGKKAYLTKAEDIAKVARLLNEMKDEQTYADDPRPRGGYSYMLQIVTGNGTKQYQFTADKILVGGFGGTWHEGEKNYLEPLTKYVADKNDNTYDRKEGTSNKPTGGFADVGAEAYYADAVEWAVANGIAQGYDEKTFGAADNLTREQLAAILYRYGAYKKYDVKQCGTLEKFLDAHKIESYAKANMRWALGAGIITGRTETALEPQGQCTRAEVAVMLQRFMENMQPSDTPTLGDYLTKKYDLATDKITIYAGFPDSKTVAEITDRADIKALQDSVKFTEWEKVPGQEGWDGIEHYYVVFNDKLTIGIYYDIPYGYIKYGDDYESHFDMSQDLLQTVKAMERKYGK